MGFFSTFLNGGVTPGSPVSPALSSPYAPAHDLSPIVIADIFGELPEELVSHDTALKVPGIKRAMQMHQDTISTMPLVLYKDGVKVEPQPAWLSNTSSGIAPVIRTKQLVRDLFLDGWALLGCKLDDAQQEIIDAIAIPSGFWKVDKGRVIVDSSISKDFQQRLVVIPLGANGILIDGIDTIRQARALDKARTQRLATPPASTELHLNNPQHDNLSPEELTALGTLYAQQRTKNSVAVTPSYIDVKEHAGEDIDLFDSATNSIRLDIANHAAVPASAIEGSKTGSGGDMSYSNTTTARAELYDLGSRQFADAIASRLSLDDVCPPGTYLAFDTSEAFAVPTPTTPPLKED